MKRIIQLATIISLICLGFITMAAAADVYKIGSTLPLTGDLAMYGLSEQKGVDLAIDQVNRKGGINGIKLKGIHEDNQGEAGAAVSTVQKLIHIDKVPAIVGAATSTRTMAICPIAEANKVVLISPGATATAISTRCGSYTFRVIASDGYQGVTMANLVLNLKYREAGVMYMNNDYGRGLRDVFVSSFEKKGGKVLISTACEATGKDFRTELLKVKASGPKVVALVADPVLAAIIFRQANELGMKVQWVASEATKAPETIDLAGDAVEGVIVMAAFVGTTTPEYIEFQKAHKALYGVEPGVFSDFAYDATMMVISAIKAMGYSGPKIKEGLMKIGRNYRGVTGIKTFDEYGDVTGEFVPYIVENGKYVKYNK